MKTVEEVIKTMKIHNKYNAKNSIVWRTHEINRESKKAHKLINKVVTRLLEEFEEGC